MSDHVALAARLLDSVQSVPPGSAKAVEVAAAHAAVAQAEALERIAVVLEDLQPHMREALFRIEGS